uniref:Si:ch211-76l23.4 n=2 Tax=Latimeria chalumnae TaxID=7897 RepID=H3B458_LATCH
MDFRLWMMFALTMGIVHGAKKRAKDEEWNYRDGSGKVDLRGVANLTQVLDNWRYDILNEMKNLLIKDHQAVLPDYARIQPLSEALDDLYKEFNALKERLGELSNKFANIEIFIDEVRAGNVSPRAP